MTAMGAPYDATEVAALEDLLRRQWLRLRAWLGELDDAATTEPSVLDGWSVGDLVAHLGRAMDALAAVQPTPDGTVPLSLGEYLGGYARSADEIAQTTRELAAQIVQDPLTAVDRRAEAAFAKLTSLREAGPDPVVQARRGPIHLSEMLLSRLLELVVHADDLVRSTTLGGEGADDEPGRGANPLDADALHVAARTLLEIAVDRGGWSLEVADEITWVRLAAGRIPLTTDAAARALRATYTSDSLPDLGTTLPLL